MFFASDNGSPVPPEVLAALARANDGNARGYGADEIMTRVTAQIREIFEAPEAAVFLVATGTAANALALATFCPPWGAVFCHTHAHVAEDECGAPEFYSAGAKLVLVPGAHGKMTPEALVPILDRAGSGGVHSVQKGILSVTNVTEAGTIYTPAEVAALAAVAHDAGVPVHLDGARFANALVASGASPAGMTWKAGVDVLSFGGTKNGLMGVEAVVLFNPARAWEFELRRKRGGHLFSKHRYLSAQMEAYLDGGLWLRLATHANHMGALVAEGVAALPGARLMHPAQANIVFADWPAGRNAMAHARGAVYYDMPAETGREAARLVSSWNTTEEDVAGLIRALTP